MGGAVKTFVLTADSLAVLCDHRHALFAESLGIDCDEHFPGWRSRYIRYYARLLRRDAAVPIVARVGDEIVGSAIASVLDDYRGAAFRQKNGQVNGMFVVKRWRRRHVGTTLLDAALAWLSGRNCLSIQLAPTESARAFYESAGFRYTSRMYLFAITDDARPPLFQGQRQADRAQAGSLRVHSA